MPRPTLQLAAGLPLPNCTLLCGGYALRLGRGAGLRGVSRTPVLLPAL